jgi:hypothetical protein
VLSRQGVIVNRRADFDRLTPRVTGHFSNHAIGVVGFFPPPAAPPISFKESVNLVMTDQDLIFCALRQISVIIGEYLESGSSDADELSPN